MVRGGLILGGLGRPALVRESCAPSNPQSNAQKNPAFCGGASLRCFFYRLVIPPETTRPRHSFPLIKPLPTDKAASGAQKSVRSVQCGSQAIAQKHQGPLRMREQAGGPWHYHRTRVESQRQYLPVMTLNASIIAPGREGSQLGHAVVQTSTLPQ